MRHFWLFIFLFFLISYTLKGQNNNEQIVMDGFFEDWNAFPGFIDSEFDGEEIDLVKYSLTYDHQNLYLYFETTREIDLFDGTNLKIYFDLDGNSNTGENINTIGAELILDFAKKEISFFHTENPKTQSMSSFDVLALPTYTSKAFEISIPILKDEFINTLVKSTTINIQLVAESTTEDYLPNLGEYFSENIEILKAPIFYDTISFKQPNTFRLLHYNTFHDGITNAERKNEFKALVKAINPDIISFNELWNTTEEQAKLFLNSCFPNEVWSVKKISGNITATKFEVNQWFEVSKGDRILGGLFTAKLETDTFQVYHTNMHLSCCAKDDQRKKQILANNLFVDSLKTNQIINSKKPMIISGDINLVGFKEQYDNLLRGKDFDNQIDYDNTELADVCPKSLNTNVTRTWRDAKSKYPPGRLDYIFYSDSNLKIVQSFVLDTETLLEKDLKRLGLSKTITTKASDHLPLVVDFSIN